MSAGVLLGFLSVQGHSQDFYQCRGTARIFFQCRGTVRIFGINRQSLFSREAQREQDLSREGDPYLWSAQTRVDCISHFTSEKTKSKAQQAIAGKNKVNVFQAKNRRCCEKIFSYKVIQHSPKKLQFCEETAKAAKFSTIFLAIFKQKRKSF